MPMGGSYLDDKTDFNRGMPRKLIGANFTIPHNKAGSNYQSGSNTQGNNQSGTIPRGHNPSGTNPQGETLLPRRYNPSDSIPRRANHSGINPQTGTYPHSGTNQLGINLTDSQNISQGFIHHSQDSHMRFRIRPIHNTDDYDLVSASPASNTPVIKDDSSLVSASPASHTPRIVDDHSLTSSQMRNNPYFNSNRDGDPAVQSSHEEIYRRERERTWYAPPRSKTVSTSDIGGVPSSPTSSTSDIDDLPSSSFVSTSQIRGGGVPKSTSSHYTNYTKHGTDGENNSIRSARVGDLNFNYRNSYDTRPVMVRAATPLSMHTNFSKDPVVGVTDPEASHIDFNLRKNKVIQGYNTQISKLNSGKEVVLIQDPKRVGLSEWLKVKFKLYPIGEHKGVEKISLKYVDITKRKLCWHIWEKDRNKYESYEDFKKSWPEKTDIWKEMKSDVKNDLKSLINDLVNVKNPFHVDASKSSPHLEHSKHNSGKKYKS